MTNAVSGGPKILLRLEGLGVFVLSLLAYAQWGSDWSTLAWFFLAPDLAMLAYVLGPKAGAAAYNLSHTSLGPVAMLAIGVLWPSPMAITVGLIWAAHIGFDRALGYGLKYAQGFTLTHLGTIGRQQPPDPSKN